MARKPNISEITERAETLKELWKGRNDGIYHNRDLFHLNHYGSLNSNVDSSGRNLGGVGAWRTPSRSEGTNLDSNGAYRVTSSEYTDFTLSLRSMVMAQAPVIRCYSDKESKVGDERAQSAEKVLMAIRYVNQMRQEADFVDAAVHEQFSSAWTVFYSYFDEELAKQYEKDGNWHDFPIIIKTMPAEHCYMKPGGGKYAWREMVYSWEREIADVEDEFNVKLSKSRAKYRKEGRDAGDELVDFYDYWWREGPDVWHAIVAGDDWVKKPVDMSKWYKDFPYTVCTAISVPSPDPAQMGVSPYMSMEPNVELQEDLTSRIMTGVTYHADPTIIAMDGDGTPIDIDKSAGGIVHIRTGQDVKAMQGPTVSQDVYQMLQHVNAGVQRSGLPAISYGMGLSGLSGYAISLMGQGGQLKMVIPVSNLERALTIVMNKTIDLLVNFYGDKDVFAYGQDRFGKMFSVKMKGDELKGLRVDVKLKPRVPQDEVARANRARLLKGIVSDFYIKDSVLEMQDPVADNSRMRVEQFMQHPLIMAATMARAAVEWGVAPGDVQAFMSTMLPNQQNAPQRPPGAGNPMGGPPPGPGAQVAPSSPDELAQQQMLAAAQGNMPTPEGAAAMSMGGRMGGGY